ncbi:hypothetical protein BOX15_Mlig024556g3, partial [Macrostomum lignano]
NSQQTLSIPTLIMRLFVLSLCCLQLALLASAVKEDEELFDWQEFHLTIENPQAAATVRHYVNARDFLVANENHLGYTESVVVPPQEVIGFMAFLGNLQVKYEILEKDVGGMLLRARLENKLSARAFNNDPSTYFAQSSEIYTWMEGLVSQNSGVASLVSIGRSYEGRNLRVLRLNMNGGSNKPVIFIDAAIHAREWLAPATLNYIVKQLINDYKAGNSEVRTLMNKFDWHFMPVVNPDGYDYTFRSSSTRYWRKTRKPYRFAYGADPNRNFDFMFGGPGTSNNPSSDIYHGPNAFSEPETKALSDYLTGIRNQLQRGMYISFHTYGQWWLTPPGYTRSLPSDHTEMMRVGNAAAAAIRAVSGQNFRVGQPANVGLYEAAGGSYDWVKYRLGVKYSFTPELRPYYNGSLSGFSPSAREIPNSGKEIYQAVKAVVKEIM